MLENIPPVPSGSVASLYQPGDVWSHAQCPAPNWTPSGNLCLQISLALDNWMNYAAQTLFSQWIPAAPHAASWRLFANADGSLNFTTCEDGVTTTTASGAISHAITWIALGKPAPGAKITIRVVRQSANAGNVTTAFYVSTDYDPILKTGSWTQVGTTQTSAGTVTVYAAKNAAYPTPVELGASQYGSVSLAGILPAAGKFYWANVYDGVDDTGQMVCQIDNRQPWAGYNNTPGNYTDPVGNVWNLQGPAAAWKWDTPNSNYDVPIASRAGWGTLSHMPVDMVSGSGVQMNSGTWQFMPFTLSSPVTILGLAVDVLVAATNGTSAMQFGIWQNNPLTNVPAKLISDLSPSGTLDLTTTGIKTLTLTTPVALIAGNYWVGAMWNGSATTNPQMNLAQGAHPQVVAAAYALNKTCYTQNLTTVPNIPALGNTGTGIMIGYQQ